MSPTIQWAAIAVVIVLATVAAFVFFGGETTGGGHSGLAPVGAAAADGA